MVVAEYMSSQVNPKSITSASNVTDEGVLRIRWLMLLLFVLSQFRSIAIFFHIVHMNGV